MFSRPTRGVFGRVARAFSSSDTTQVRRGQTWGNNGQPTKLGAPCPVESGGYPPPMARHLTSRGSQSFIRALFGPSSLLVLGLVSGLSACGSEGGGNAVGGGGPSLGGSIGGALGSGGSASGGRSSGGAASGSGGTGGGASSGGAGAGSSPGAGGATPSGGSDSGGSPSGGDGAGGGGNPAECTRELLKSTLDAYFDALQTHDPSTLPLSDSVKFTENAEESEIGSAGLWMTAGAVKYSQSALDVEECTVAAHSVVPDGSTDVPVAVRIKLENAGITEVEMIVARMGDYAAVASNTGAIISMGATVGWDDPVPEAEQNTHDELVAWMNKYFRKFPQGVCNVTSDCRRLENGGGNFSCGAGASCAADPGPNDSNLPPRLLFGDPETGVGAGLTVYQDHVDMHMFKMIDGEVHAVQAILSHTDGETGWD
jgi:hypothetical protein